MPKGEQISTEAQTNANRENSKKSTGPRTAEGKAAASQNAFKHGLFVNKAVVRDESQDEYDRHRQVLLAEWDPAGQMESIVAARLVNLTWRLERAQRMQNQSIDYLGIAELRKYRAGIFAERYHEANGVSMQEAAVPADHLLLGRLAVVDWTNDRVLDRMMLYERRIENSMYKTMHELERLQKARKDEQARAAPCRGRLARASRGHLAHDLGQHSESNGRAAGHQSPEESPPARRQKSDLKKQSQFAQALMVTKSCERKGYDNEPPAEASENKADQSQFRNPGSVNHAGHSSAG
ncbi:MAG: hypothetical protein ACYSWQ_01470 [Planctomycetota bacterium]